MKIYSFNFLNISILLFITLFDKIINEGCNFTDSNGNILKTNSSYFNITVNDNREDKEKCFILSNSFVNSGDCCYDVNNKECVLKGNENDIIECPKRSIINNNCGTSGIYEPKNSFYCTEIPLVNGYCCFVKFKDGSSSCIRTKVINKVNKNSTTEQINKFIQIHKKNVEIDFVICNGINLKFSCFLISFFIFIFIL